jgi:hypothetical protein
MKEIFLNNEIWILTFGAAFQRANIYKKNALSEQKGYFKTMTKAFIEDVVLNNYKTGKISDEQHIENIKRISEYSANFSELFEKGKINFGIAQKMLNLYLKYQWSLGSIEEPPHFPVDRIIQGELNKAARQAGTTIVELLPWTQFEDEKHYLKVIDGARELILKNDSYAKYSLPELELELFNRR